MCCVGSFAFPQSEALPPTAAGGIGGEGKKTNYCSFAFLAQAVAPVPPFSPRPQAPWLPPEKVSPIALTGTHGRTGES